jgi:sugar phosphate isomerase/epimerase
MAARISMNELTTYRWSFEEDVQHYADEGLDAIAVWRQKLSDYGEEKGIELISECGLAVSSLLWAGGFTGSDGRSHSESIEDAHEAIRLAAQLRAPCVVVYSGPRAGHTHNHARRLLTSALKELLPHATDAGVSLALEPVHSQCAAQWTFLTDLSETVSLLENFDHAHLKLAFDTYHFGTDEAAMKRLAQWTPYLGIVHLGDARRLPDGDQDRCPLGAGIVPLQQIVTTLVAAGYAGYFDIKLMGQEIETVDYRDLLRQSRDAVAQLFRVAQ